MMCARRSGRRFLVLHRSGGRMGPLGPLVWRNRKRVEDETQGHVEFGDDAEFEPEIEAIVGALEPTEEGDATAVRKQTRTAMAHSRTVRQSPKTLRNQITRGWRVALGAVIVERLAISVGIVQRNASKHQEMTLASFHANWSSRRLPTSCQPTNHIWRN